VHAPASHGIQPYLGCDASVELKTRVIGAESSLIQPLQQGASVLIAWDSVTKTSILSFPVGANRVCCAPAHVLYSTMCAALRAARAASTATHPNSSAAQDAAPLLPAFKHLHSLIPRNQRLKSVSVLCSPTAPPG